MVLHSAVCPVRVGRDREVETLRENAASRRTTMITGPAGVGKSQLSSEALRLAAGRGLGSLVGHCTPESAQPFEPVVTSVRRRIRTMDRSSLSDLFSGGASLAAALFPDVANLLGAPSEPIAQVDLFAAIWQLLFRLGEGGAVLLLEDLHWADTDTLQLLTYLIRENEDLGMWIVGTYRDDEVNRRHPLTPVLADLTRERLYDELPLHPLQRDDIGAMVRAIFEEIDVDDDFVDTLYERTRGNPFFVEELLKVLIERGDVYRHAGDWVQKDLADIEMSSTVRETLLSRTRSMDPEFASLLHLAALDGNGFDVPVLAAAADCTPARVEEMIAQGLSLQLLTERRETMGSSYSFRHALTREALDDEIVGPDRRHAHLRLAAAIIGTHPESLDGYAATIADHYLGGGDHAAAILWNRRAASVAAASVAAHEAGRRYELVLGLMSPDDPERLVVLMEAVAATSDGSGLTDVADARLSYGFATEARRLAQRRADPVAEARAIEALAFHASRSGDTPASVELLRRAIELVHGHDDFLESWICARLCGDLTRTDRIDEAMSRLPAAMALAAGAGNHLAQSRLHIISMMNSSFGPGFASSLDAALAEARLAGNVRAEHSLFQTAGYVSLWCGDFAQSHRCFERSLDVGERLYPHDAYTRAGYVWLLSLMGRYEELVEPLEQCQRNDDVPTRIVALTGLYEMFERRGLSDAAATLEELWRISKGTGESQRSVPALAARARWRLIEEDVGGAASAFWEVLDTTVSGRGRGSHWLFSPDIAAAWLNDENVEELERWARAIDVVTVNDDHPHNRAANELVQGYVAIALSDWTGGRTALERAERLYEAMPCPARVAETHLAMAELHRRAGDASGEESAAQRAVTVASEIGAARLAARAQALIERASIPTRLATVLFTDIVRSTERMSQVGDRAWRSLLDRHDSLVRRELDRFGGQEINTTGDGFVAAFDSPAQALRCALEVRRGLRAVGIAIRAGLHSGECQVVGHDLRGLAVTLAARVCAAAQDEQVLVTSTVRDLVTGLGFAFVDEGTPELKGVTDRWRVFSL